MGACLDPRPGTTNHVDMPESARQKNVLQTSRKPFRTKTLRLLPLEKRIFDQACEALNGMERSQLMQEAVIDEAARLGVRWSADPAPPLESSWRYMPQRGGERTAEPVNVNETARC
jgi:hypothetical protein